MTVDSPVSSRRNWPLSLLLAAIAGVLVWACLAPISTASREQLFEAPKGGIERGAGGKAAAVRLTLGLRDVLVLRNSASVPLIFGPLMIAPGQDFRLPFGTVGETEFASSAHASGKITVLVEPMPNPGLVRLRWRLRQLSHAIRTY